MHGPKAIEFEATVFQHTIHIPESVPEGAHIRVLLLLEGEPSKAITAGSDVKTLLAGLAEGLEDADLARPREFGREELEWGS